MITVLIALIGTVDPSTAECHTFLGFSTCQESEAVDMKYPFSVEWWVTNVDYRRSEVRRCLRVAQQSPLWYVIEHIPLLDEFVAAAFEGDVFERIFHQATEYYRAKEFPVDLLVSPELTYTELYLSFKAHQGELFAGIRPIMEAGYFDEEVQDYFRKYLGVIEKGAMILTLIPTAIFDPYLNVFEDMKSKPDLELPPLSDSARFIVDSLKSAYHLTADN